MTMTTFKKSVLAVSLFSVCTFASAAQETKEEIKKQEERNVLIGMGSGAAIGAGLGGPVGGVIGGLVGILFGENVSDTQHKNIMQAQLQQSESDLLALQHEYEATLTAYKQLKAEQSQVQVAGLTPEQAPIELTELPGSEANIQFKTASWQLEQHYTEQLDKVAQKLKADPGLVVQLFGYADRRGDESYNLELSEKRADQVKRYLLSMGVPSAQVETAGYGEAQPVTVKQTWENDFFDRRVVVRLTSDDAMMTAKQ